MKALLLTIAACVALSAKICAQAITPGEYEAGELLLAYNPQTHIVSGYYHDAAGDDHGHPVFTCIFYIEGRAEGSKIAIKKYYPEEYLKNKHNSLHGSIIVKKGGDVLLQVPADHSGCCNFDGNAHKLFLDSAKNWVEIRYVKTAKTYFYSSPNQQSKRKGYLIKGDAICIDKIANGWLHCTYADGATKGWVDAGATNLPGE